MRKEYDFSNGVRGKHADRVPPDAVFVSFDPEVTALLDGTGPLSERLRTLAVNRKRGRKARLIRSVALSAAEYRALKPVLDRLGARAFGERDSTSRQRRAG